jgi:hypothetical protein
MEKFFKIVVIIFLSYLTLCFLYFLFNNTSLVEKLDKWQQLVGSIIGAGTPLALFLISEAREKRKKQKEFYLLLEKNIISAINNLADIDNMLHRFIDVQLKNHKKHINEDEKAGRYSIGQAFVPLSATFTLDKDILKTSTPSSYLENLIMDVVSTSQELPLLLVDIGRQFERTMSFTAQIGMMKLNSHTGHNKAVLDNLAEFEKFLEEQTFGANIPIYLRKLVSTKIALQAMSKWGLKRWKKTFDFKSGFTLDVSQKMTDYFKPEVNKQIEGLQGSFKSKLLFVEEYPQK